MDNNFVSLEHIYKVYPNGIEAVHDFNLDIKKHDFIVIVGPSGCGKSTTLRMVAGLEDITDGKLLIDGELANDETPKDRNIAMVFQSYSLYPHMTVKDNISFGIRMRKHPFPALNKDGSPVLVIDKESIKKLNKENSVLKKDLAKLNKIEASLDADKKSESLNKRIEAINSKIKENETKIDDLSKNPIPKTIYRHLNNQEIDEKVAEVAKILELDEYLDRKPSELSGGQRQRVALGRAIIRNAKVFLMDEPLSNLDAKLRGTMRSEIIKLHKKLNATIIYVTHDQTEAMTMASRIVVMKDGFIQQIGTPNEIYQRPSNTFVANFIGSPAMNIIPAKMKKDEIVLPNGFKIPGQKDSLETFKNFYENEIKIYEDLLSIMNTDAEEIALSAFKELKVFVKSGYSNPERFALKGYRFIEKPLNDLFDKFNDQFVILSSNKEIDAQEIKTLREELAASKTLVNKNFNKLEDVVKNLPYFGHQSNNEYINEVIKENKAHFNSFVELVLKVKTVMTQSEVDGVIYAANVLESIKTLLSSLNKTNKDSLVEELDKLIKEVKTNVVLSDVNKAMDNFDKLLKKVNTVTDSDIRRLYYTCLRTRGTNKDIDWMLSVIDKSNMSKKIENKLRNEYLVRILIEGLIAIFKDRKKGNCDVLFGIRPEDIHEKNKTNIDKYGSLSFKFDVSICELLGKEYILHLDINSEKNLVCQLQNERVINVNDQVELVIDESKIHLFDSITEKVIY